MLHYIYAAVSLAAIAAMPLPLAAQTPATQTGAARAPVAELVPFSVEFIGATDRNAYSAADVGDATRWSIAAMRPVGDKTALELHCAANRIKLDLSIDSRMALSHKMQVGDGIEIRALDDIGYVVKKGKATIALLEG